LLDLDQIEMNRNLSLNNLFFIVIQRRLFFLTSEYLSAESTQFQTQ